MTDQSAFTVDRHYEADQTQVFRAWLDPELARYWLFAQSGDPLVRCEIDDRPGGRFTLVDRREDGDAYFVGEYEEIDQPSRLIFRFATGKSEALDPADGARVTVTVVPEETGCRLTLVQEVPPAYAPFAARMREGWQSLLVLLGAQLGVWVEKPDTKPFRGDVT